MVTDAHCQNVALEVIIRASFHVKQKRSSNTTMRMTANN